MTRVSVEELLPQWGFSKEEHKDWASEQFRKYEHRKLVLQRACSGPDFLEGLKAQHSNMTIVAFTLHRSGVKPIEVSNKDSVALYRTRSTSMERRPAVALVRTRELPSTSGTGLAVITHTIATFGERIGLESDITTLGNAGIGVRVGRDALLGVMASHHGPHGRQDYVPYNPELGRIADLLEVFSAQPSA